MRKRAALKRILDPHPHYGKRHDQRSLRNVETQKKKARRAIPRAKVTRCRATRRASRRRLKKAANKARGAKAAKG